KRTHRVPYRNSKRTHLIKFSPEGHSNTAMIVFVALTSIHLDDTHNAPICAEHAAKIKTKVVAHKVFSVDRRVRQYVEAVSRLNLYVAELRRKAA
ncbi:uncharacterized protein BXZ73DRAFT_11859, partial [Epithele typhae]|uniref:uncharacterized protein n=1 Tax=Epithele typhae TaxID=378194 RepID=UPI0020072BA6